MCCPQGHPVGSQRYIWLYTQVHAGLPIRNSAVIWGFGLIICSGVMQLHFKVVLEHSFLIWQVVPTQKHSFLFGRALLPYMDTPLCTFSTHLTTLFGTLLVHFCVCFSHTLGHFQYTIYTYNCSMHMKLHPVPQNGWDTALGAARNLASVSLE